MKQPDLQEVTNYFYLKLNNVKLSQHEAEGFYNYYMSCGWMVGKKPMKAWKFAVLNWIRNIKVYSSDKDVKQTDIYEKMRAQGLTRTRIPNSNVFKWLNKEQIDKLL